MTAATLSETAEPEQGAPQAPRTVEFTIHGPMISASGDAAERKFHLYTTKAGKRWVVADQPNAGENIYVDGGKGSEGMAGRTLTFALASGETVDFIGPWKAGANALFAATGVDVRDTIYTRGVAAFGIEHNKVFGRPHTYLDVQHYDETPVLGSYERVERIAQRISDESGRIVYFAYSSKGGGSAFRCKPAKEGRS